jgi:hypothetical protein
MLSSGMLSPLKKSNSYSTLFRSKDKE